MGRGFLSLQAETVDVGKFGWNILAVLLRWFEARLPDRFERFVIEAGAAAFGDLGFGDVALWIDEYS